MTYTRPRRVTVANPRRRRRRARRNPELGFRKFLSTPTLKTVGFTIVGVAGTPFAEGFIQRMLPATLQNRWVNYGVKIVSAYGVGMITGKIFGREAGRAAYIGGAVYVALGMVRDFLPGVLPAETSALTSGAGKYMGAQPMLGKYTGGMGSFATLGVPERLQPRSRF